VPAYQRPRTDRPRRISWNRGDGDRLRPSFHLDDRVVLVDREQDARHVEEEHPRRRDAEQRDLGADASPEHVTPLGVRPAQQAHADDHQHGEADDDDELHGDDVHQPSWMPRNRALSAATALTAPHTARAGFERATVCRAAATPDAVTTSTFTITVRP
jgi:hypothetical protein